MDDTTSDPGTFVSVDNFLESPAHSLDPLAVSVPQPPAEMHASTPSTANRRDSSFMWTLFQGDNNFSVQANTLPQESEAGDHHIVSLESQNEEEHTNDEQAASHHSDNYHDDQPLVEEGDTLTDASDLCVDLDEVTSMSHRAAGSASHWLQSTSRSSVDDISAQQIVDVSRSPQDTANLNANVNAYPSNSYPPSSERSSTMNGHISQADQTHSDVADTPGVEDESVGVSRGHVDSLSVGNVVSELSLQSRERLYHSTNGMVSFEINNPFNVSSGENAAKIILYSKEGPLTLDEQSTFDAIISDPSCSGFHILSKFLETIIFQRQQLSHMEDTAVALSDGALHSAAQRFDEVERRRSYAMNALINELDVERNRSYDMETENHELKDRLEFTERRLEEIEKQCRKINPEFSFEKGVEAAVLSLTARESIRRESAEEVFNRSAEMDELSQRLLQLDATLSESRKRSNEVQTENALLKEKLAEFDAEAERDTALSPVVERESSPARDALVEERNELVSICKEQREQIDALHQFLQSSSEEKRKVNDAFLNLNVDMELARTKIGTLQKQRDTAEREWRAIEKLRSSERKTYHDMCNELSQNIVAAVNDLNEMESKVHLLTRDVEDRESVIQSLRDTITELEEQLTALTDAAICKTKESESGESGDENQVSVLIDTVVANLRGELERSQSLLGEKSEELTELRRRVAVQDEVTLTLRRECDRFRSIADARACTISPSRRGSGLGITEEQQNMFLQRLSEKLGCQPENGHELVSKLISRVEELLRERSEFESNAVRLRSEVLERERKLHVVRSEMQAEISTLKAEVQHLENLKNRAAEECKFAENKVFELLGEKDLSKADSIGDITFTSVGSHCQSGLSDIASLSRRESMISSVGADNTIHWNDPLVAAAIQSLSNLAEMKDKIGARYRALREKLDRIIRRGDVEGSGVDTKALMIESQEIQADLSGVVDMQQDIIDKLRPRDVSEDTFDVSGAEFTLPYVAGHDVMDEVVRSSGHMCRRRQTRGRSSVVNITDSDMNEATGFLREQLKQTRDLYNEKSRANAQLCGAVAELKQELEYITKEKKSTEQFLSQVSENHNSFLSRLSGITGTERSMVAIEDFVRCVVQETTRMSTQLVSSEQRTGALVHRLMKLTAQKRILSHMIYTYQSKYHLDMFVSSSEERASARRRFRVHVLAILISIRLKRVVRGPMKSLEIQEIDTADEYDLPSFAPIARQRAEGPTLMNASVAIAAVPRLESAILDRERRIEELKSAMSALDNSSLPSLPEDVRNSIHTSFAYDADILSRKQDLARRLQKVVKEKAHLEARYSKEKETRIALEAKLSRYSERLVTAKKRLSKASSQAESKERTYKAAIKYLKQKADKAVEDDFSIDENTDPWATPESKRRAATEAKSGPQVANAKSLSILRAQIAQAEGDLKKTGEGSAEHKEIEKYIQGLHKAVHRLKQSKKPTTQAPTEMDGNLAS